MDFLGSCSRKISSQSLTLKSQFNSNVLNANLTQFTTHSTSIIHQSYQLYSTFHLATQITTHSITHSLSSKFSHYPVQAHNWLLRNHPHLITYLFHFKLTQRPTPFLSTQFPDSKKQRRRWARYRRVESGKVFAELKNFPFWEVSKIQFRKALEMQFWKILNIYFGKRYFEDLRIKFQKVLKYDFEKCNFENEHLKSIEGS